MKKKRVVILALTLLSAMVPGSAHADTDVVARIPLDSFTRGVAVNSQTRRAYVATFGKVSVVDTQSQTIIGQISSFTANTIAVDEARNLVHVAGNDSLTTYDGSTNQIIGTAQVGRGPIGIAVDPSTGRVYVANRLDGTLSAIDASAVVGTASVGENPLTVAVDVVLRRVYVANTFSDSVSVIDADTLAVLATIEGVDSARGIAVDPATHRVFVANHSTGWVTVIDGPAARIVNRIWLRNTSDSGCCPGFVALNPSLGRLSVANGGRITTIDTTTELVTKIGEDAIYGGWMAVESTANHLYIADQARQELIVLGDDGVVPALGVLATSDGPTSTYEGKRWTNGNWTVALSCRTACTGIEYAVDGGSMNPYAGPLSFTDEGEYRIEYRAQDGPTKTVTFVVDRTAPDGTATAEATEPSQAGWTRGSWIIHYSCHNPQRPNEMTCLPVTRVDGFGIVWPSTPAVGWEGLHHVAYRLEDAAGNSTPEAELIVGIDRTAPSSTMSLESIGPSHNRWARDGWRVTFGCDDAPSGTPAGAAGCARTEYRIDDGNAQPYTGPFDIGAEGDHVLRYRSFDVAGNEENEHQTIVSVDRTPPATTAALRATVAPSGRWTRGDWVLTLACTDPATGTPPTSSGCASSHYSSDGGSSLPYDGEVTLGEEGDHLLAVGSIDNVHNGESEQHLQYGIDRTPPRSIPEPVPIGPAYEHWARDGWRVTLACEDVAVGTPAGSAGCGTTEYQVDGGALTLYSGSFNVTGEGDHTVRFRSIDLVGNVETFGEITLSVDETPPISTDSGAATVAPSGRWTRGDWTITLTCFDPAAGVRPAASGCASTSYEIGSTTQTYHDPFRLDREGTYDIAYWSTDHVSNGETAKHGIYGIDRTAPIARMREPTRIVSSSSNAVRLRGAAIDPVLLDGTSGSGVERACFDLYRTSPGGIHRSIGCEPAVSRGGSNWGAEIILKPGVYDVSLRGTDVAGNTGTSSSIVIVVL